MPRMTIEDEQQVRNGQFGLLSEFVHVSAALTTAVSEHLDTVRRALTCTLDSAESKTSDTASDFRTWSQTSCREMYGSRPKTLRDCVRSCDSLHTVICRPTQE